MSISTSHSYDILLIITDCFWDFLFDVQVTFNNGLYTNKLCGHGDQGPFVSTGFEIRFKTDDSVTGNGFTAVFECK